MPDRELVGQRVVGERPGDLPALALGERMAVLELRGIKSCVSSVLLAPWMSFARFAALHAASGPGPARARAP